ncbi:MAG TPA: secretion protein, partial [Flavobacterium sp.]|nr:secretion protein [Flavobacterium sp.]
MKKLLLLLLASVSGFSQLYVSPSSYMYVKDRVLFVKQDINLDNNGLIYLRNDSQLLQGTATSSQNRGLGQVSVFQEGTSDNYDYNYWCSPVGIPAAASG